MATQRHAKKYPVFRNWFAGPNTPLTEDDLRVNEITRRAVIENVIDAVQSFYLDPAAATRIANALQSRLSDGTYDNVADANTLARTLTSTLQELSGDKHFRCLFGISPDEPSVEDQVQQLTKLQYGFGEVKRLDGNIAVVEITGFVPVHWHGVRERVDGILSSVSNADALIIDLRRNRGGDPKTVALVASYLREEPTLWLRTFNPADGSSEEFVAERPLKSSGSGQNKLIIVITSSESISGGEDLSYGLQARKRATVVGEKTAGAANMPFHCVLEGSFLLSVPHKQVVHPVTGSSWEGVGVIPDIEVPAGEAFERALEIVREEIRKGE
ncbi:S41 family peptidase [Aspergillus lucknowensis]|uniref:ClpP/crotonase-like domain-containing protein n=1 Tax=Aspergillus lucknowensis TaxID=176173 RepID=A0ABR4LPG0_9EURO